MYIEQQLRVKVNVNNELCSVEWLSTIESFPLFFLVCVCGVDTKHNVFTGESQLYGKGYFFPWVGHLNQTETKKNYLWAMCAAAFAFLVWCMEQ